MHRKPGSAVTSKSQRPLGTPDWKRRLRKDIASGQSQDLFSPTGLEGIFRPLVGSVVADRKFKEAPVQNGDLRSSPPSYPLSSLSTSERRLERVQKPSLPIFRKGVDRTQSNPTTERGISASEIRRSSNSSSTKSNVSVNHSSSNVVSVRDLKNAGPSQRSISRESLLLASKRKTTSNTACRHEREVSGKTDDSNENISPYYVSRHNTVDGHVDYAPIDLSMIQLRAQMDQARQQQQYKFPPSASDKGMHYAEPRQESSINVLCSDWQNQSLPDDLSTGTAAFILNGGFITTRRGAPSNESSFMRRSLSPSSEQRTSKLGERRSLSVGASSKDTLSTGDFPQTPRTPEKSDIIHHRVPSVSLSPLKLFDHHDTFTNKKLLRRLANFDIEGSLESQNLPNAEGTQDHATHPSEERKASRHPRFGDVELQYHGFDTSSLSSSQLKSLPRKSRSSTVQNNLRHGEDRGVSESKIFSTHVETKFTAQGKRPLNSPPKDPRPKRRRTLQQGLKDPLFSCDESYEASGSVSKLPAQSVLGKKRKDALHGRKSEAADPDVLALRQILRPRTLTQSQSFPQNQSAGQKFPTTSKNHNSEDDSNNTANGLLTGRLANIAIDMVQHIVSDDARKPSVTTADFHREAQQVMQLLRMQGRPLAGLAEQASEEQDHPSESDKELFDHDSTKDDFSRPPSREGSRPREANEQPPANMRVVSRLQKFKEDDETGIVLSSSLKSLKLSTRISGQRNTAAKAQSLDPQMCHNDEEQKHDSIQSTASSDLSTQRSIPTNSSQSSKGKAVIPPEAVAHLLGTEVAGMTFDHANQRWVKCKSTRRPHKLELSPHPGSVLTEEDVFARISDLSTEDIEEEQWQDQGYEQVSQRSDDIVSNISRHDHAPRHDFHYRTSSRPLTADGAQSETLEASSAPSKFSQYTSSGPLPETRATSWGDEALRSKVSVSQEPPYQQDIHCTQDEGFEEEVEHEISILDGRELNSSSSPRLVQHQQPRVVTVSFSSPLESQWNTSITEGDFDAQMSTRGYSSGVTTAGTRRRRISITHRQSSANRKTYRRLTKGCHDLVPRPMSRLDEHDEDDVTKHLTQDCDADIQVALSTPLPRHHTSADQLTLGGQVSSNGFQLTPLSAFTVHPHDTSLDIESDYLARRVGRNVYRQGSLATQDLVKKLQDAQPDEPYWDYLPYLVLSDQKLSTLHMLDEFCTSLIKLDVSHNRLSEVNGAPLSVRHLKATHNLISDLTPWAHLRNLQYLNVSGNQLTSLQGFRGLVHLRKLQADDNRIESLKGIEMLDGLIDLSLSDNVIEEVDFDGCEL